MGLGNALSDGALVVYYPHLLVLPTYQGKGIGREIVRRLMARYAGFHGGFAAAVLDSVTGCAVHTLLEAGSGYGTVDLNVKMLKAIPRDQELIAEGRVLHMSRSLGVSKESLRDGAGTLLAHATCTCAIRCGREVAS